MKTGMQYPLIGLAVLLLVAILGKTWNNAQIDIATARMQAQALGTELPSGALAIGEIGAFWVIKAIAGTLLAGAGTAIGVRLWADWKKRKRQSNWMPGPNANYQRQPPAQKAVSNAELYRMMMYQQMQQGGARKTPAQIGMANDDEPEIVF
jgi:phosphate/sulfate permease